MESTSKSAMKSFIVLASAITVGVIVGTFAVSGIRQAIASMKA